MNTEVLDRPTVAEQTPSAIATNIVTVQGEVAKFDKIAAGLAAIEAAHPKNVIVDAINTPAGMRSAEAAWRAWRGPRLEVEKARKAAKAPVLALGKAIDSFAAELETKLLAGEDHYKAQITAEEERRAAVKAEEERKERERIGMHQAGIATIRAYLEHCRQPGMTAARVANGIASLAALTFPPEKWQEYAVPAANAQCETLEAMRKLQAELQAREDEAARLEAQRIEQARVQAELDAQRAELARQAAELAAQRAESERLERLADENRKRLAADAHRAAVRDDLLKVALLPNPAHAWADADPDAATSQPTQAAPETVDPDLVLAAADETPAAPVTGISASEPTLTVTQINDRIKPLRLDAAGIELLGFARQQRPGPATHFLASDWPALRAAIIAHAEGLEIRT